MTQLTIAREKKRSSRAHENLNRDLISKILGTVVYDRAFFFYEDIGKPTGDFAVSLSDLCGKINKVDAKSLSFHMKRGDFENWVRDIISDTELSDQMRHLKGQKSVWKNDSILKRKIHMAVLDRIVELQDMWQEGLKRP
jgi:hypothetical protein